MGCHACCVLGKKRRGRTLLAVFLLVALVLLVLLLLLLIVTLVLVLIALVLIIFTVVLHEEHLLSAWLRTGLLLTAQPENIRLKIKKMLLTRGKQSGILIEQNKEGRLHPPHLQPMGKEVNNVVTRLPVPAVCCCADAMWWYPRFVIFGWRCFDHS